MIKPLFRGLNIHRTIIRNEKMAMFSKIYKSPKDALFDLKDGDQLLVGGFGKLLSFYNSLFLWFSYEFYDLFWD